MRILLLAASLALIPLASPARETAPRNAIIVVADGLRGSIVDAKTAPNLDALRREGVSFPNSHSLFPTVTTANASAIATGHYLGDTGDFANVLYVDYPAKTARGTTTPTPFIEDNVTLGDVDAHFGGDYLHEITLLAAASQGFSTAAIGKLGPTLIQDHAHRDGNTTFFLDDRTGLPDGIAMNAEFAQAIAAAGLPPTPPAVDRPNRAQQQYALDVLTRVVLPKFQARGKPFVIVLWLRDPDSTQHSQLDSRYGILPGINGGTSLAAIRNTDNNVGQLRRALKSLGLDRQTNLFITSDHGFSTISKQSDTSHAGRCHYDDVPLGHLPPGFLAIDIATALDLTLRDPDARMTEIDRQRDCETRGVAAATAGMPKHPVQASGLIGGSAEAPSFVVTAGAGSALIYARDDQARDQVPKLVRFLLSQDYTGGVFVDDAYRDLPGTIPMRDIGLIGDAATPRPTVLVSFRSYSAGCDQPFRCGVEVADSTLSQGQGMHGAFSRADTWNFMAALGPDFRRGFVDPAPTSNADIAQTLAHVLKIELPAKGSLVGRVLTEALPRGKAVPFQQVTCWYAPADLGRWPALDQAPYFHLQPALQVQTVGDTRYFDAAGLLGRTLGLDDKPGETCTHG